MNMQPGLPSKASTNGSPYIRGGEREGVLNKAKSIKSHPANAGMLFILCDISALRHHVLSSYAC